MRNSLRIIGLLAASVLLLAAGEAPNNDIAFLNSLPVIEANDEQHAVPFVEETFEQTLNMEAPELAPVMPEAESLHQLVSAVREMPTAQTDREFLCLASAVYYESKGEPLDGQLAVAQVIINRVETGRFGGSVCDVVTAPKQFSFVRGGTVPTPRESANWEIAKAVATIAMSESWNDIVGDATHFHATYVNPRWKLQRVATVGRHIFYR